MHAGRGRLDEALCSFRRAAAELQVADVYPTLILGAARVLDALAIADGEIA